MIPSERRTPVLIGATLVSAVLLGLLAAVVFRAPPREPLRVILPPEPTEPASEVLVYVSGAVQAPGVYRLSAASRAQDALEAAGGPVPAADLDRVNLAEKLRDGAHILVPRLGEQLPGGTTGGRTVNLNTATEAELEGLRGIGKVRAQRMVASRKEAGPFREPFDLVTRGIVPLGVFQQIKDVVSAP